MADFWPIIKLNFSCLVMSIVSIRSHCQNHLESSKNYDSQMTKIYEEVDRAHKRIDKLDAENLEIKKQLENLISHDDLLGVVNDVKETLTDLINLTPRNTPQLQKIENRLHDVEAMLSKLLEQPPPKIEPVQLFVDPVDQPKKKSVPRINIAKIKN